MSLNALKKRFAEKAVEGVAQELMEKIETLIAEVRKVNETLDKILELMESAKK